MKPKLKKVISIKLFGEKKYIQEVESLLDSNLTIVKQGIILNPSFDNYEEWIHVYTAEPDSHVNIPK